MEGCGGGKNEGKEKKSQALNPSQQQCENITYQFPILQKVNFCTCTFLTAYHIESMILHFNYELNIDYLPTL